MPRTTFQTIAQKLCALGLVRGIEDADEFELVLE